MAKSQLHSNIIDTVERAIAELRRGQPVLVDGLLVASVEGLKPSKAKQRVIITAARAGKKGAKAYAVEVATGDVTAVVGLEHKKIKTYKYMPVSDAEFAALQLMKTAELMPACVVCPHPTLSQRERVFSISIKAILAYEDAMAYSLVEVCRAPLMLKHAGKGEIIGFRPMSGGKEHYAIVVGKGLKSKAPLIRIHSSCYTGDLLASLACDCGDQLHTALHKMQEAGGGIVLYLMQEGRGIGLVNKLRTYALQAKGMDTVEANQALGFDDDERLFLPAAEILKRLKIKRVKLLTNNPRKVSELERFGITVEARVPHVMEAHVHTANYMKTKSHKMGHIL